MYIEKVMKDLTHKQTEEVLLWKNWCLAAEASLLWKQTAALRNLWDFKQPFCEIITYRSSKFVYFCFDFFLTWLDIQTRNFHGDMRCHYLFLRAQSSQLKNVYIFSSNKCWIYCLKTNKQNPEIIVIRVILCQLDVIWKLTHTGFSRP